MQISCHSQTKAITWFSQVLCKPWQTVRHRCWKRKIILLFAVQHTKRHLNSDYSGLGCVFRNGRKKCYFNSVINFELSSCSRLRSLWSSDTALISNGFCLLMFSAGSIWLCGLYRTDSTNHKLLGALFSLWHWEKFSQEQSQSKPQIKSLFFCYSQTHCCRAVTRRKSAGRMTSRRLHILNLSLSNQHS